MKRARSKPWWLRVLQGLAWVSLCLLFLGIGVVTSLLGKTEVGQAIVRQKFTNTPPERVFQDTSVTFLILGCDKDLYYRGTQVLNAAARSDMMMIARLDFNSKRLSGLSIPRDTRVEMPGESPHRINAFHAMSKDPEEAKQLAKRAVEYLLPEIQIDRVIVLNFDAFKEMIDLVGGVEVFVDKKLKYTDKAGGLYIDLEPGRQVLDGEDAMGYVRYRKGDSDFVRQDRQKALMHSFKDRIDASPGLLGPVLDKFREVLGNELSSDELAAAALFAQAIGNDNIKMAQLPVFELPRSKGQAFYLDLDRDGARRMLMEFGFIDTTRTTYNF